MGVSCGLCVRQDEWQLVEHERNKLENVEGRKLEGIQLSRSKDVVNNLVLQGARCNFQSFLANPTYKVSRYS